MSSQKNLSVSAAGLLSQAIFIIGGYLLYVYAPYFKNALSAEVKAFLPILGAILFLGAFIFACHAHFIAHKTYTSNAIKAIYYLKYKIQYTLNICSEKKITTSGRYAALLLLVKILFIPLMLQFVISNFMYSERMLFELLNGARVFSGSLIYDFVFIVYPLLVGLCFLVDTVYFLFGYMIYSKKLNNKIRSVDSTLLGWTVALLCYPPFNYFTSSVLPALYQDYPFLINETFTFYLRILMLIFLIIYTAATVNLGWKCSNLTNRGIVTHGVYAWVRHPAYLGKVTFWWLSLLPIVGHMPEALLYMAGWTFIYFMRAITEERHLKKDPEYIAYCSKVKYRFIPKLI